MLPTRWAKIVVPRLVAPLLARLASGCGAIRTYRALNAYEPVYTNATTTDTTTDVTSRPAADGRSATRLSPA